MLYTTLEELRGCITIYPAGFDEGHLNENTVILWPRVEVSTNNLLKTGDDTLNNLSAGDVKMAVLVA